jgi:type I restriction enzyme S subunit
MIVISPIKGVLDGQFLSWFFDSPHMQVRFQSIHTGSTLQHLNCRDVKELSVPVPPIEVQKRIVCEITAVQTHCRSFERIYGSKLTEINGLRTSVLHHAFSGDL